ERVSREAPVLILKYQRSEMRPGGAANALANLRALGARPMALGVVGEDEAGRDLLGALGSVGIDCSGVLRSPDRETVRKTRVLAGGFHTVRQQIVRIDREGTPDLAAVYEEDLFRILVSLRGRVDAVLFSDYGQGAISESLASRAIQLGRQEGWCLTADSRHRLGMFRGVWAACPNESEAGPAVGIRIRDEQTLIMAGGKLLDILDLQSGLLVTQGRLGISVFEPGAERVHLPIFLECDAADVTGAGDTVASVLTLALTAGASLLEAATLASCAGSLVVMKRGTATVSAEEILSCVG
ncbi:MAG: hypothetical protein KAW17_05495, partial [Candidatus Eisenbacteria sp.]|nr:hypothetical protein [Candidatus Eisenbacteria bacterium]